jgi:hypothetical protein
MSLFTKVLLTTTLASLLAACAPTSSDADFAAHLAVTVTLRHPQPVAACLKRSSTFQIEPGGTPATTKVTTKVSPGPVFTVTQVVPILLRINMVSTTKDKGSEDGRRNLDALTTLTDELSDCGSAS